jgi:hypothetical protein
MAAKIVIIGAGSASFGLNTLSALLGSERLRGSHLALVDRNEARLATVGRLAGRLNREWGAEMTITTHPHHNEALDGAAFVVSAIEVPPRETLSPSSVSCSIRSSPIWISPARFWTIIWRRTGSSCRNFGGTLRQAQGKGFRIYPRLLPQRSGLR